MALTKCKECGHQISKKAASCPQCGAVRKRNNDKMGCGTTFIVVTFAMFMLAWVISESSSPGRSVSAPNNTPSRDSGTGGSTSQRTSTAASTTLQNSKPPKEPVNPDKWRTSSSTDEMTGEVQAFAFSKPVGPTRKMSFPYGDVTATLAFGCDSGSEWLYIAFSESPNLLDTQTEDGYNTVYPRIKFDDTLSQQRFSQEWGSRYLHFRQPERNILKVMNSNTFLLELNWHGSGKRLFNFSLTGSTDAVQKARNACAKN